MLQTSSVNNSSTPSRLLHVALVVFMASIPLESTVNFDTLFQLGGVPVVTVSKLAGAMFFAAVGLWWVAERPVLRLERTHVMLIALLVIAAVSSALARERSAAIAATVRYASFVALYLALTQVFADARARTAGIRALVIASGVAAAIALGEFLFGPTWNARTPYGDANDLAFVFASVLPLALWMAVARRSRIAQIASLAIVPAIALSFSRGAWLALAVASLVHLIRHPPTFRRTAALVAAAAIAVMLAVAVNPTRVRSGVLGKLSVAQANVTNRFALWQAATTLAAEHPLLGIGPGNFTFYYAPHWNEPGMQRVGVAHNAYLDVVAETGIVGLALFAGYLAVVLRRAGREQRRGGELRATTQWTPDAGLHVAVHSSLVVVIVGSLFLSTVFLAPIWIIGSLATALSATNRAA